MVRLSSSPVLHAECGTNSILKCEISSSKQGLSVKYMGWSLNDGSLCFVKENLTINYTHSLRRFHCMYSHGHLSLVLHDVQPQDGGNSTYVCKLRSNKGATHTTTRVEFKGQSAYLLLTLEWNKKTGRDEVFGYFFSWILCVTASLLSSQFFILFPSEPNKCSRSSSTVRGASSRTTGRNGVGSVRPIRTLLWCISFLLVVILK